MDLCETSERIEKIDELEREIESLEEQGCGEEFPADEIQERVNSLRMQLDDLRAEVLCENLCGEHFGKIKLMTLSDIIMERYLSEDQGEDVQNELRLLESAFKKKFVDLGIDTGWKVSKDNIRIVFEGGVMTLFFEYESNGVTLFGKWNRNYIELTVKD